MLDPEGDKSFKVYANAHFFGNWHRPTSGNDLSTAKIRTGYAILYAGCPIICCIKLQMQIALSKSETDYITLVQLL